jgi:hypothetical protein
MATLAERMQQQRGGCPLTLPVVISENQWGAEEQRLRNQPHIGVLFRMFAPAIVTLRVERHVGGPAQFLSEAGQARLEELVEGYKADGWIQKVRNLGLPRKSPPEYDTLVHEWGCWLSGVEIEAIPGIILDFQAVARDYTSLTPPPRPLSPAESLRRWLKAAQ